jgi:hypothetical protein
VIFTRRRFFNVWRVEDARTMRTTFLGRVYVPHQREAHAKARERWPEERPDRLLVRHVSQPKPMETDQ